MTEVYIRYNPYRLNTEIKVNGNAIAEDSPIAQKIHGKRLQNWIGDFPEMLASERRGREYKIIFHGNNLDYDDVKDAFEQAKSNDKIEEYQTFFEEAADDSEVYKKLLSTYSDLMEDEKFVEMLDVSDKEGLASAIRRVENDVFPIHVIATMSSGKSTLINAFLRMKLMPSKNEACTAIITEILDTDAFEFTAKVYDEEHNEIEKIDKLTYEKMNSLNEDKNTSLVSIEGDIPFLDVIETKLKLVDTPGPNNARNTRHRETTYHNINSAAENMILYVLNYTQLGTDDDENLLRYVAEEIRKGGKETRDRFLFVLNKMDEVKADDSVENAIAAARQHLSKHGIEDPQIFLCSAYAALSIRTLLADIDPYDSDAVDEMVEKTDNDDIAYAAGLVKKINRKKELHLEKYSTLTPSENQKLRERLDEAIKNGDRKTEALIHTGICSIESAIKAYVHKYAKAKKIREFAEPLEVQLIQAKTQMEAKMIAISGGSDAEELQKRCNAVCDLIEQGEDARRFKKQIDAIDPLPEVRKKADALRDKTLIDLSRSFRNLGSKIEGRKNVLNFYNEFADNSAEAISSLAAQLDILINQDIIATCSELVMAYQRKLEGFDNSVGASLEFGTADLVNGSLSRMKKYAADFAVSEKNNDKIEETIDDIHEDEVEVITKDVIVKEKVKKTIQDGVKKIKTGEERVVVGTFQKKVGTREVKQKRGGLLGVLGLKKKVTEDVFETFEEVEYRPTYEYVPNMKEIIEEIPTIKQEREEKIHYVVKVDALKEKLITPIRMQLNDDVDYILESAGEKIEELKKQFIDSFDVLDGIIKDKYTELEEYIDQQDTVEGNVAIKSECEEMLQFIEDNLAEIRDALDI